MTRAEEMLALAAKVAGETGMSNDLDVQVEIALFEPDSEWASIRANAEGTKTICVAQDGKERTFWARDFTISARSRRETAAALRARAAVEMGAAS